MSKNLPDLILERRRGPLTEAKTWLGALAKAQDAWIDKVAKAYKAAVKKAAPDNKVEFSKASGGKAKGKIVGVFGSEDIDVGFSDVHKGMIVFNRRGNKKTHTAPRFKEYYPEHHTPESLANDMRRDLGPLGMGGT